MSTKMSGSANLSCILYGPGVVRFEDQPVPQIQDPHDVLIRISYVGVCGSDVHLFGHGGDGKVTEDAPCGMGHEASGIIDTIGSGVSSVKVGDRVAIEPGRPCRRCKQCKAGRYNICPQMQFPAHPPRASGTLTRLYKMLEDFVHKIPDSLSLQEAVLAEPLSVAIHAVRLAQVQPGQKVLVQGCGTIGLLVAAVARAFGARSITVTDINKDKLSFAKSFAQCGSFVPDVTESPQQNARRLKEAMNAPDGVDVTLECTGVESSAQSGLHALEAGGVYVQVGMGKPDQTIPLLAMSEKEIVLKTCFRYGPGDYDKAVDMLSSGEIDVKPLISSTVPFEQAEEAWAKTRRGEGLKNLIEGVRE